MLADLADLEISINELETYTNLDFRYELLLDLYRGFILKHKKYLGSALIIELALLIFILIIVLPLSLIILSNSAPIDGNDANNFITIIAIAFCLLLGINVYLFQRVFYLKTLANLLKLVDKYNGVIQSLKLVTRLKLTQSNQCPEAENKNHIIEALWVTRHSLINALKFEAILREKQLNSHNRYELIVNLENDLVTLMALENGTTLREYEQLVDEVLEIGLNVHKAVKNLDQKSN